MLDEQARLNLILDARVLAMTLKDEYLTKEFLAALFDNIHDGLEPVFPSPYTMSLSFDGACFCVEVAAPDHGPLAKTGHMRYYQLKFTILEYYCYYSPQGLLKFIKEEGTKFFLINN